VPHHTAPILALDMPRTEDALDLLDRVGDSVGFVKVGLELYLAEGPPVVREMRSRGLDVFLDLKLHDIPNTVGRAVRAVGDLGVDLLTVHAAGGGAMLDAAAEAGRAAGVRIVAVTVLTSLDASGLEAVHGHSAWTRRRRRSGSRPSHAATVARGSSARWARWPPHAPPPTRGWSR
jgi:orotidine 5'-phosphate decarboxylase subfamily 1